MSAISRCLNSTADAREKVSISSCSCLTSSSRSSDASLCTSTRVLPLPGPAATTMHRDSLSEIISICLADSTAKSWSYLAGVMLRSISRWRSPLKYFDTNRL